MEASWYLLAMELFDRIKHGDDDHRQWLKRELEQWAEEKSAPVYYGDPDPS